MSELWKVIASSDRNRVMVGWEVEASTPLDALREALAEAERTTVAGRREPPMPAKVGVSLTVREDGSRDGLPVVVLTMADVAGDARTVHLSQQVAMELVGDLAVAYRQLAYGRPDMPPGWDD